MERKAAREHYDADIQLEGGADKLSCFANAFIKFTYRINPRNGQLSPAPAIPLLNNWKDDSLDPRIPAHTDYWPWKTYTDVGVVGSAFSDNGAMVTQLPVSVTVGKRSKRLMVFGQRLVEFNQGRPEIGSTEAFNEQPLGLEHAYGGCDFRVPFEQDDPQAMGVTLESDHPGLYPRNPWGTGYLAVDDPVEGMPLPTQEDAGDLLTNQRLIASSPDLWFQQPLAAHIGWVPVNCYPRSLFMAIESEPWFPPPDNEQLQEVKLGHLANGYRELLQDQVFGSDPHWRFHQEAVPDLMFNNDLHGAPVGLTGLHAEHPVLEFSLPDRPPEVQMKIEAVVETLEPELTSVEIRPNDLLLTMTYTASMDSTRPFIPGIHKNIPIAVSVNRDKAVRFETPPTIKNLLKSAEKSAGTPS